MSAPGSVFNGKGWDIRGLVQQGDLVMRLEIEWESSLLVYRRVWSLENVKQWT